MWKVKQLFKALHIYTSYATHFTFFLPLFFSGQVRQMILEEEQGQMKLTHITIPAAYSSGITLFARLQSELGQELLNAPELPVL